MRKVTVLFNERLQTSAPEFSYGSITQSPSKITHSYAVLRCLADAGDTAEWEVVEATEFVRYDEHIETDKGVLRVPYAKRKSAVGSDYERNKWFDV